MRKLLILTTAVLTLGGCALRTNVVMQRDLKALIGKDVHLLVEQLGYPERQDVILGEKIFTWHMNDCTLNVGVDQADHVTHYDYNGSRRECSYVADKLES
jgi:hypothetical protein